MTSVIAQPQRTVIHPTAVGAFLLIISSMALGYVCKECYEQEHSHEESVAD